MSRTPGWLVCLLLLLAVDSALAEGFIANMTKAFVDSEFEFQRGQSNAPFLPLAFVSGTSYADADVASDSRGMDTSYSIDTLSAMGAVPFLVSPRDALVGGFYMSHSDFKIDSGPADDFTVKTVGIPLGWMRQVDPNWQAAAFIMPMGHEGSQQQAGWSWQYLGGTFARYVQTDTLWWAFGVYVDLAPEENFVIPYVGASWSITERWTLSAVMPWPAVLYAPTQDWLFRLGVSPSGASWSVSRDESEVAMNLDAWDFGLGVERRVTGNLWAALEAGWGGFRGLRISDHSVEEPDFEVGSSAYISLDFSFRPAVD